MGFPRLSMGVEPLCMRVIRMKPMTVVKHGDGKTVRILVSELNPPICAVIKELAQGGTAGSVPISFSSRNTMARVCPPPPCPCRPCVELTPRQKLIKYLILGSKISFLGGTLLLMWYIGVLGATWDTWNLKECVKAVYYSCRGIEFRYWDKCKDEPEEKDPLCANSETPWNNTVIFVISGLETLYYALCDKFRRMLSFEYCDYVEEKKEKDPKKEGKEKEEKVDHHKIWQSIFNELDPINMPCRESRDYFAFMMRDDEE